MHSNYVQIVKTDEKVLYRKERGDEDEETKCEAGGRQWKSVKTGEKSDALLSVPAACRCFSFSLFLPAAGRYHHCLQGLQDGKGNRGKRLDRPGKLPEDVRRL